MDDKQWAAMHKEILDLSEMSFRFKGAPCMRRSALNAPSLSCLCMLLFANSCGHSTERVASQTRLSPFARRLCCFICFAGKETAINYAPGLAADLHRYPAADLLKGHYVVRRFSSNCPRCSLLLRASCRQSCAAAALCYPPPPFAECVVARAFWDRQRRSASCCQLTIAAHPPILMLWTAVVLSVSGL